MKLSIKRPSRVQFWNALLLAVVIQNAARACCGKIALGDTPMIDSDAEALGCIDRVSVEVKIDIIGLDIDRVSATGRGDIISQNVMIRDGDDLRGSDLSWWNASMRHSDAQHERR
jgi:hypothetical protein